MSIPKKELPYGVVDQFTDQQKKALDLQRNLIVTAGAGSGKTTILVERYFQILLTHPDISVHNILAFTFTEKAASEMKQRIVELIYRHFNTNPKLQERLFKIIKTISEIQISTIHAFCTKILKENFLQIQLNPDFRIAMKPEIDELLYRIFWKFFYSYRPDSQHNSELSFAALRELDFSKTRSLFYDIYYRRAIYSPFIETYSKMNPDDLVNKWEKIKVNYYENLLRPLIEDAEIYENIKILLNELRFIKNKSAEDLSYALKNLLNSQSDSFSQKIQPTIDLLNTIYNKDSTLTQHHVNNVSKCDPTVQASFNFIVEKSQSLHSSLIPDADDGNESSQFSRVMCGLSHLLNIFLQQVEEEKDRQQILDFDGLLIKTRNLLKNSPEILDNLQRQYQWILVDEFQDTDLIQNEIIQLLCTDQNNIFFVGDPKQSIYGFRQADVGIFQEQLENIQTQKTNHFPFTDQQTNQILFSSEKENKGVIELPDNFRSSRSLIQFYNYLFERVLKIETDFDVDFKALSYPGLIKGENSSRIELRLINCEGKYNLTQYIPFEIYHIIEIIKSIVGKQKIYNPEISQWEFVDYEDIAILTRDRRHWSDLSHALQVAEIPFETYQGSGFFQTQEVQDIYYILKSITDPEDNFALIASLRSPYIGVSDVGLFYLSQCQGENYNEKLKHLQAYFQGAEINDCFQKDFSNFLQEQNITLTMNADDRHAINWAAELFPRWHPTAHRGEYSLLLNQVIETLNIPAVLQSEEFSKQKIANLNKLLQFTYGYEQKSSGRITDFLNIFFRLMKETLPEGEATIYFEGGNQVTILTIHSAKGLEFPVVILPFLETKFKFKEDIYYHKNKGMFFQLRHKSEIKSFIGNYFNKITELQTIAEEKRLFYVAATRARDHLFFVGASQIDKTPTNCFLNFLLSRLKIDPSKIDPGEVTLKEKFGFHIIRHEITEDSSSPTFTPAETKAIPAIEDKLLDPETLLKYSHKIQLPIQTGEYSVTQLMIYEENPDRYIYYHYFKNGVIYPPNLVEEYSDEPGGLWWGTLVHKSLENFHKRAPAEDAVFVEKLINQFRVPENEIPSLQPELLAVLTQFRNSKIGKHLLKCEQQSEVRIVNKFSNGILVGIIDRIFQNENAVWEVLDFKTNRISKTELTSLVKKYTSQISYYALLLANLFPHQKIYPVRLYFLSIDEEYYREFAPEEIEEITPKAEDTIKKIQKLEEEFFGLVLS
jgi:ATP-dependent helicase/nuclease subunit A